MHIEKRSYSRAPWRLVTKDGREVTTAVPFTHPGGGGSLSRPMPTLIHQAISGDTKAECLQAALDLLERLLQRKEVTHGDE